MHPVVCQIKCTYCTAPMGELENPPDVDFICEQCFAERKDKVENEVKSKEQTIKETLDNIQWDSIDGMINDGKCRIIVISKELKVPAVELRKAFDSHYKDRITYKRGRNGGVFWSETKKE